MDGALFIYTYDISMSLYEDIRFVDAMLLLKEFAVEILSCSSSLDHLIYSMNILVSCLMLLLFIKYTGTWPVDDLGELNVIKKSLLSFRRTIIASPKKEHVIFLFVNKILLLLL